MSIDAGMVRPGESKSCASSARSALPGRGSALPSREDLHRPEQTEAQVIHRRPSRAGAAVRYAASACLPSRPRATPDSRRTDQGKPLTGRSTHPPDPAEPPPAHVMARKWTTWPTRPPTTRPPPTARPHIRTRATTLAPARAESGWLVTLAMGIGLVAAVASPLPRSSRSRKAPSRAPSCAGSPWAGPDCGCSRSGTPSSPSVGRPRPDCTWGSPGSRSSPAAHPFKRPSHGSGRPPCWCWSSGCGAAPAGTCTVAAAGSSCTWSSPRWPSRRSEADTKTIGEATDATTLPSTGRLVDVDGHKLYISCVGSGSPTVVLEPGAGGTSAQMGWISPEVAGHTRVCVYDRAGRGWSEPADSCPGRCADRHRPAHPPAQRR